ncbi:MAG: hypothetical protein ABMB14_39985 [Myxococcota bacterium]
MNLVDIHTPGLAGQVIDALRHDVVVLQLPPVYTLIAAPTSLGVTLLNRAKARQSGKNYGTAIGSIDRFWRCVTPGSTPPGLGVAAIGGLTGAFVRCRFAPHGTSTPTVRGGTHQGLLLGEPWRGLFRAVEDAWADRAEPDLFGGHAYTSVLCTSCNESGHPDGSIVGRSAALRFADQRRIGLMVTCDERATELGSYPIFAFGPSSVTIERTGPRLEALIDQLPAALRPTNPARTPAPVP